MNYEKRHLHQALVFLFLYLSASSIAFSEQRELMDLSVEDLLNIEVTSVAKKAKSLNDSPAAIFVITQDDIRRIGATSIPEALRLAPGIDVSRIDTNKWAVTARGFNGRFANKLLVMIDGRNAYTRAFSGVYWENQDVMLEDVERIEVIRGPGATLWGANAVNGVINIITKHSGDTLGGLLVIGAGSEERGFGAFRYGGELSDNTTARAYLKGFKRDESSIESGEKASDDLGKVQVGFRMDSQTTLRDAITFQGDVYYSSINQFNIIPQLAPPNKNTFNENIDSFGGNLLVRHQHTFSSISDYSLQIFYDFYERDEAFFNESRHVIDIDFQHRFAMLEWNDVVWGASYRYNHDKFHSDSTIEVAPPSRNDQVFSAFVQDEITLIDDTLWFTLGSKFEHNDYSGFEVQPTARLIWAPHHQHRVWGAVSRAVRTPSRLEHNINVPQGVLPSSSPFIPAITAIFKANNQFDSEAVISYELGYRTTFINDFSIDLTAFYTNYSHLRSLEMGVLDLQKLEQSIFFANNHSAHTYGVEIATVWQMLDWWRWDANYSLLKTKLRGNEAIDHLGSSPQQQVSLRSSLSPLKNIDIDVFFRYVDSNTTASDLGTIVVNDYVSMDIRLAWRPVNNIELALVGQNLLAKNHLEYIQEAFARPVKIDRGVYGKLAWHF